VTLINKSYGNQAKSATVSILLPKEAKPGRWQRLDLKQKENDPAAKSDITLGDSRIDSQGCWSGRWMDIPSAASRKLVLEVGPASATVLRFSTSLQPVAHTGSLSNESR